MKKLLTTLCFGLLAATAFAQTPKLINYQGVARGNDGAPVLNQAITLRFRILQGSITGSVAYTETQSITTNSLGLILTQIGLKADLGTLSWKNGPYFLEVGADMTGGSTIDVFGIQQIMGVPYAFHAATVPAAYNATTNVLDVGGNTFTLSSTPQTTLTATGIASVQSAATNSFVVSVPTPSFSTAGPFTVSGTYPDYTMTAQSTSITGTGNAAVTSTATNQFNVNVPFPQVTITSTAGTTGVGGSGTNSVNINIPAGVTPSIAVLGVITRTASGSNFTLNVPGTSVTASGAANVTSSGTNTFNINVPQANVVLTGTPGLPGITSPGTNSFNINIPAANVAVTSTAGAIGVSSPGTNTFNINVPQTSVAVTSTAGAVGVTSAGTNSFSINVPPAITPTITPFGALTRTAVGSSFSLTVPQTNVALTSTAGAIGISSAGTNSFNINVPAPSITPIGLVQVTQAFSSFTVNVPLLTYTAATAGLGSGSNSVSVLQALTFNNGTLTSGPSSNSVSLSSIAPWRQAAASVTLTNATDKVSIGGTSATENLQVESTANTSLSILASATSSADISFGTSANHNLGRIRYDNTIGAMSLWTAGSKAFNIGSTGIVTIGSSTTTAANTALVVSRAGAFDNQVLITGGDANNFFGGMVTFGENINPTVGMTLKLDAGGNRMAFTNDLTGTNQVMSIGGYLGANNGVAIGTTYAPAANPPANGLLVEGFTGMGTNAPAAQLHVLGTSILQGNVSAIGNVNITGPTNITGASSISGNLNVGVSSAAPADARIYGYTRMGLETATSQGPTYPTGSQGLVIRRIFSNTFPVVAGHILASSGTVTFERDGTNGGFRVTRTGGTGQEVCHCMGVTTTGASLNKTFNNLVAGQTQIYSDLENVIFMHCMFGDPFAGLHTTEISITRRVGDYWWMGTVTSTFNQ